MAFTFLLKGLAIGFSIAAPVGPIGVLCIRRSLLEGRQVGLATGMGAATADAIYGCVAAFGLTAISSALVGHRSWLGFLGGLFLCYLGVRTFMNSPAARVAEIQGRWVAFGLSFHALSHPHQSDDHPVFCGCICWLWTRIIAELSGRKCLSDRRVHWFSALVAAAQ